MRARLICPSAAAPLITAALQLLVLSGCKGSTSRRNDTSRAASGDVDAEKGWYTYNRGYDGARFADLNEITTSNVATLKPVCEVGLGEDGSFQSGPLVIGDTLIVTTPHSTVALNATNCTLIWRNVDRPQAKDVFPVNRGAGYANGRVYRGTPDGRLVALDAKTGNVLWQQQVGSAGHGEFISSAPLAYKTTVYAGIAGSDWGVRGRMMAFDASDGKEKWRFNTIPMGNEPGAESWKNPSSAAHGGGAQWSSYALDTAANELFVPVANPAPDFAPQTRPGNNLYTNSVIVLDAGNGQLKWYHQFTPHDGFDWDIGAPPVLFGGTRVAVASKDGNLYVLDRQSHNLLFTTPVTTVSNADSAPTVKGVDVCPGPLGGVEWNSPAYSPQSKLIYVGAVDWCARYTTQTGTPSHKPGQLYMGTSYAPTTGNAKGWLTAVDAQSGQVKWKFQAPEPIVAGVTPTSGGVVFNGDLGGTLYAFDANTGKPLLQFKTPGAIAGGIITYRAGGKQYVATTSGNISRTTFNTTGSPTLIILALGAPATPTVTHLPAVSTTSGGASPTEHQQEGAAKSSTTGPAGKKTP